jgi:hypothetical protein
MSGTPLKQPETRRSTRLSISIPVVISGVDIDGNDFSEGVRTQVVNKHGGKVATTHRLKMGAEVLIENPASHKSAKSKVVWLDGYQSPDGMRSVGLQLMEAQNIWGIAFPPDDWTVELREDPPPARRTTP